MNKSKQTEVCIIRSRSRIRSEIKCEEGQLIQHTRYNELLFSKNFIIWLGLAIVYTKVSWYHAMNEIRI